MKFWCAVSMNDVRLIPYVSPKRRRGCRRVTEGGRCIPEKGGQTFINNRALFTLLIFVSLNEWVITIPEWFSLLVCSCEGIDYEVKRYDFVEQSALVLKINEPQFSWISRINMGLILKNHFRNLRNWFKGEALFWKRKMKPQWIYFKNQPEGRGWLYKEFL